MSDPVTFKPVTFNPGPSQLLRGVADDIERITRSGLLSESHRGERVRETTASAQAALSELLGLPNDFAIVFAGSATEIMEALVRNLSRQRTGHLTCGAFSHRFRDVARACGRETVGEDREPGRGFDLEETEPADAELLCLTHVETSTGVELDMAGLRAWRDARRDALVAVDVVASIPTRRHDWTAADAWLFSVQKGFGLPAGLGVLLASPRAIDRSRALGEAGADRGWLRRLDVAASKASSAQSVETPNVLGIALLEAACRRLQASGGIDVVERETIEKARRLHAWLDDHPSLSIFAAEPRWRARTVTALALPEGTDAAALRSRLAERGLVLGAGYGELRDTQVRIANFPAHAPADHERLMAAIDEALT